MSAQTQRLLFAGVISVTGVVISYVYTTKHAVSSDDKGAVIAHLESARNEVQRKSARKIIWQQISEQEMLRAGESVRTGPDSDAKIQFEKGMVIELDPESVVTLSMEGDKAILDFIKGNLYVKAASPGSNLALKSGGTNIDVSNADLSLGKSSNGAGLDVQVLRGSANVNVGGQKLTVEKDKSAQLAGLSFNQSTLKIKSPQVNETVFVRVDQLQPLEFQWQPVSDEYVVSFEMGPKRDFLTPVSTMSPVSGASGTLKASLKPGTVYWRLVAVSKKDSSLKLTSSVNKLVVVAETAAKLLEPADKEVVVLNRQKPQVVFRWVNPSKLEKQIIEIAKDPLFKKVILVPEVEDQTAYFGDLEEEGTYYWRVSGFRQGNSRVQLTSLVSQFTLKTKYELLPPSLKQPLANSTITFEQVSTSGLFLTWEPVAGVNRFQVQIVDLKDNKTLAEKTVSDQQQLRVTGIKPGQYSWTLYSLSSEDQRSKASETRRFIVQEVPRVLFADGKEQENYFYVTPSPSVRTAWKPYPQAAKYNMIIKGSAAPNGLVVAGSDTNSVKELPSDGIYQVTVEAFDTQGKLLARSTVREMMIQAKPFLPPPQFAENIPQNVNANRSGSAPLTWKPVGGAKNYLVQVKTESGAIAKEQKTSGTATVLKNLLPGNYKISLSSVDEHGRVGPVGEIRELKVPDLSDAKAPKLKGIKFQ